MLEAAVVVLWGAARPRHAHGLCSSLGPPMDFLVRCHAMLDLPDIPALSLNAASPLTSGSKPQQEWSRAEEDIVVSTTIEWRELRETHQGRGVSGGNRLDTVIQQKLQAIGSERTLSAIRSHRHGTAQRARNGMSLAGREIVWKIITQMISEKGGAPQWKQIETVMERIRAHPDFNDPVPAPSSVPYLITKAQAAFPELTKVPPPTTSNRGYFCPNEEDYQIVLDVISACEQGTINFSSDRAFSRHVCDRLRKQQPQREQEYNRERVFVWINTYMGRRAQGLSSKTTIVED